MRWLICLALFFTGVSPHLLAAETNSRAVAYKKTAGPFTVSVVRYDWQDQKRDRKVPVKIYVPKPKDDALPIIIFSHGLGGSREGYEYLGRHWASYGYVSVHLQHLGSDNGVWSQGPADHLMQNMQKAAMSLENITNRPLDVSFAIDQLEKLNRDDPDLKGKLDLTRIGVAGHSFGAFTTLAIAGEKFIAPGGTRAVVFTDSRVKAAIAMSAPVVRNWPGLNNAFDEIKIPCFHMTGTRDYSPIGNTLPEDRRVPYDLSKGADKYLVTFKDGDHMIFSGRGRAQVSENDARFQTQIRMASTAFWDAYLKDDPKAKNWLADGDFESVLAKDGVFEQKRARY